MEDKPEKPDKPVVSSSPLNFASPKPKRDNVTDDKLILSNISLNFSGPKVSALQNKEYASHVLKNIQHTAHAAVEYVSHLQIKNVQDEIGLISQANLLVRDLEFCLYDLQRTSINNHDKKHNFDYIQRTVKALSRIVENIQKSLNEKGLQKQLELSLREISSDLDNIVQAINSENEYNQVLVTILEKVSTSIMKICIRNEIEHYTSAHLVHCVQETSDTNTLARAKFGSPDKQTTNELLRCFRYTIEGVQVLIEDIRKAIENLHDENRVDLLEAADCLQETAEESDRALRANNITFEDLESRINICARNVCSVGKAFSRLVKVKADNFNDQIVHEIILSLIVTIIADFVHLTNGFERVASYPKK